MQGKNNYIDLIKQFLEKKIPAKIFEKTYRETFLNDDSDINEEIFFLLDELFVYVYGYTEDPYLLESFPEGHFNEDQLRGAATKTLEKLQALDKSG